jgi:hypothetical protein
MGCSPTSLGTTDGRAGILDRSGIRALRRQPRPTGDPARGAPGLGSVLSGVAAAAPKDQALGEAVPGPADALQEIWSQLPLTERQHFGHRFSGMVLKALGLRPCPTQEDDA